MTIRWWKMTIQMVESDNGGRCWWQYKWWQYKRWKVAMVEDVAHNFKTCALQLHDKRMKRGRVNLMFLPNGQTNQVLIWFSDITVNFLRLEAAFSVEKPSQTPLCCSLRIQESVDNGVVVLISNQSAVTVSRSVYSMENVSSASITAYAQAWASQKYNN